MLQINIDPGYTLHLDLPFGDPMPGEMDRRIRNVRKIERIGGGQLFISGQLLGDLGVAPGTPALVADRIHFGSSYDGLGINKDLKGDISLRGPGDSGIVQVTSLSVLGNMDGSIFAAGGAINRILVNPFVGPAAGRIGHPGPLTSARRIWAYGDINLIEAGEINADVRAGHTFETLDPAPPSNIGRVFVGENRGSGRFTGSIRCENIGPAPPNLFPSLPERFQVEIGGDIGISGAQTWPGEIRLGTFLTNYFAGGETIRRIVIGGSFRSGSIITTPRLADPLFPSVFINGLRGQILIGQRYNPQAPGVWELGAQVVAGDETISTPNYPLPHDALGGGSVGVVPFMLHETDCVPPNNSVFVVRARPGVIWNGEGDPPCEFLRQHVGGSVSRCWVQLRGPVTTSPPDSLPVIIERKNLGAPDSTFLDVTSEFEPELLVDEDPSFPGNRRNHRILIQRPLEGPQGAQYRPEFPGVDVEYRVRPTPLLRCDGVNGDVDPVFEYRFKIAFDCRGSLISEYDLNDDGVLDGWDLVEWLHEPEDVNEDGATNESDVWVLVQVIQEYEGNP